MDGTTYFDLALSYKSQNVYETDPRFQRFITFFVSDASHKLSCSVFVCILQS
jgi:hypothetical protein